MMLFHRLSRLGSRIVKQLPRGIYLSSLFCSFAFGHGRKAHILHLRDLTLFTYVLGREAFLSMRDAGFTKVLWSLSAIFG